MKTRTQISKKKEDNVILIPCKVLQDRNLSVLESIIEYLKEIKGLSYHEISLIINRDERNVWTVYSRAKTKRGNAKKK